MSNSQPLKPSGPAKAVPKAPARRKPVVSAPVPVVTSYEEVMEGLADHDVGGTLEVNPIIRTLGEMHAGKPLPGVDSEPAVAGTELNFDYSNLLNEPRKTTLQNNKSGVVVRLQNMVAMFSVGCTIPLREQATKAKNAEYNPRRFTALILRLRNPAVTASIFESGKILIAGCRMESDAHQASRKVTRMQQLTVTPHAIMKDFMIHNILASADLKFPIALEKQLQDHQDYATYEPEIFPALVYRLMEPKVSAMIFVTGRMVLTGCKSREDMYQAFEILYAVLKEYRKTNTPTPPDYV